MPSFFRANLGLTSAEKASLLGCRDRGEHETFPSGVTSSHCQSCHGNGLVHLGHEQPTMRNGGAFCRRNRAAVVFLPAPAPGLWSSPPRNRLHRDRSPPSSRDLCTRKSHGHGGIWPAGGVLLFVAQGLCPCPSSGTRKQSHSKPQRTTLITPPTFGYRAKASASGPTSVQASTASCASLDSPPIERITSAGSMPASVTACAYAAQNNPARIW